MIANATITSKNVATAPELLWTNPAPTSGFSAQDVTVPDEYDAYLISLKFRKSEGQTVISYVPKNASNFLVSSYLYSAVSQLLYTAVREITSINGGVISFGNGKHGNPPTINYEYGIPLYIWGIKGAI